jgi:hypothetical protein
MKKFLVASTVGLAIAVLVGWLPLAEAYERYNGGCQNCHGAFTDSTSTKGSVFPGGNKHDMHNDNSAMDAACDLCHTQGDDRDPFIGSSDGTNDNPGVGCNGCHNAPGLRAHHAVNSVTNCMICHPSDPTPPAENQIPTYYGTADSNVDNPCNTVAQADLNENWTVGDFIGLDNDGDGLYDADDPDCGQTPGEVGQLLVTAHDRIGNTLTVSYDPACLTNDNNFYSGALAAVAGPTYSGQDCGITDIGNYVWDYTLHTGSSFFVIVGHDGLVEGSYGKRTGGADRNASGLCPEPQDLTSECQQGP